MPDTANQTRIADVCCSLCGSKTMRRLYRPKRSPGWVVKCEQCGMVSILSIENSKSIISEGPELGDRDPYLLTSANLQDLDHCWEASLLPAREREATAIAIDSAIVLDRIETLIQPPAKLLDLGCGWGFFLKTAREREWETYGIEPLPGCAIHARARFGACVVTDTLRDDTFPESSFDVITALQVFEHLPEPNDVLTILSRLLRPGGILLVEVPNIDTWALRLFGKHHRHFVEDHLQFYSPSTLARLLNQHDINVIDSYMPRRHMTVHHLVVDWCGRYLPERTHRLLNRIPDRVLNHVVGINIGDIVGVFGMKAIV